MSTRSIQLARNFRLLFWIRAFLNLKVINVLGSLFFVVRGITLSEVFYLTVIFSVATFLFEVPSSYIADRWGRKKTLLLGSFLMFLQWMVLLYAHDFFWFAVGTILFAISHALFTGTDEALIYDTNRELGNDEGILTQLGVYESARRIFRIVAPLVGVFIAKDLFEWQLQIVVAIDIVASFIAVVLVLFITEPNHFMDVEEQEAGVLRDAFSLFAKHPYLLRAIFSKTIIFISGFIVWRFHQNIFTDLGVSLLVIGIAYSLLQACIFIGTRYIARYLPSRTLAFRINSLNWVFVFLMGIFLVGFITGAHPIVLLIVYSLFIGVEVFRWALFSEYFNQRSFSFNRATTLSLTNFVKNIADIPILFGVALLVDSATLYPLVLAFGVAIVAMLLPVRMPTASEMVKG